MGYDTQFKGSLKLSKPLTVEQQRWFNDWKDTRKTYYNSKLLEEHYRGVGSLDGDYGENGEFFGYIPKEIREDYEKNYNWKIIGEWINGDHPQQYQIIEKHSETHSNQPSLWCHWEICGDVIKWDGEEKFYGYIEWLDYIQSKILTKWDIHILDEGTIRWSGEDVDDVGSISFDEDGRIQVSENDIDYPIYFEDFTQYIEDGGNFTQKDMFGIERIVTKEELIEFIEENYQY